MQFFMHFHFENPLLTWVSKLFDKFFAQSLKIGSNHGTLCRLHMEIIWYSVGWGKKIVIMARKALHQIKSSCDVSIQCGIHHITQLFQNILAQKNKNFLILPSSLSRSSSAPRTKSFFQMLCRYAASSEMMGGYVVIWRA